jgi:hypothetical protein
MPLKSEICDAYGHHWCNCPEADEIDDGVGTRDGPSRGGARAIDLERGCQAVRVNSFGLARGSGSVAKVVERVEVVGDDGTGKRLARLLL